ncbi:hypothetical protein MPSEU_000507200 [Mayamaea pseudoterrestris]|nr:hypothetical protein MPSEU_000507200 [Mayamaea pseudoterrestris]
MAPCANLASGFTVSSPASTRLSTMKPMVDPTPTTWTNQSARWTASRLFSSRCNAHGNGDSKRLVMMTRLRVIQQTLRNIQSPFSIRRRVRRSMFLLFAAAFFWLGSASLHTTPTHASSSASISPMERLMEKTSPSLDKIVDRYVQNHMFDDDKYDPVESLYREAYDDATQGTYPQALREVVAESLGQKVEKAASSKMTIEGMFFKAISLLQKRGLSQSTAMVVLASAFAIGGPLLFLFGFAIVSGISKRNMNTLMKSRYGESYTLDATIKPETIVEAPDDDEDDDDQDDDEGDDDDSD